VRVRKEVTVRERGTQTEKEGYSKRKKEIVMDGRT